MNRLIVVLSLFSAAVAFTAARRRSIWTRKAVELQAPLAIPNPHYVSIEMEVNINRPRNRSLEARRQVLRYWRVACRRRVLFSRGKTERVSAVRSIGNEVLVRKTGSFPTPTHSRCAKAVRTFSITARARSAGTVTATTSKLIYILMFDNSTLADDAARSRHRFETNAFHRCPGQHEDSRRRLNAAARASQRWTRRFEAANQDRDVKREKSTPAEPR